MAGAHSADRVSCSVTRAAALRDTGDTGLIAKPCPIGNGNVGRGRAAGWNTNCTSGRSSPGAVFRKPTDSNTLLAKGPVRSNRYWTTFQMPRGNARAEMP